jgi:hypothetical protein
MGSQLLRAAWPETGRPALTCRRVLAEGPTPQGSRRASAVLPVVSVILGFQLDQDLKDANTATAGWS